MIETNFNAVENDRVLPTVRITALPSGRLVSSVASLDVERDASRDELRIAALSLARRAIRQMQDNTRDLAWSNGVPWAGDEYVVTMTIENFNGCQQNYILEEMETEFPGFVAIDLVDASQSHYKLHIPNHSETTTPNQMATYIFHRASDGARTRFYYFISQQEAAFNLGKWCKIWNSLYHVVTQCDVLALKD